MLLLRVERPRQRNQQWTGRNRHSRLVWRTVAAAAAVAGSGSAVVKLGLSDTAADTDSDEE